MMPRSSRQRRRLSLGLFVVNVILDVAFGVAGVAVVVLMASDVFQSVIVPRPTSLMRPSALVARYAWQLFGAIGLRVSDPERRESFFAVYAPLLLVALLIFWIVGLTLGFGLIFFALRRDLHPEPATFWTAVYYAGTSLLTLGYGDIVASHGTARALSLTAAAIGLGTFAIVTAFLFSVFAAFQRREAFIVTLRERTGAPPSGVYLIEHLVELEMLDELDAIFRNSEAWMADLMETHLAYPVLSYLRSTHDNQSWVGTIGALLDAATIVVTTVDIGRIGPAKMLSRLGRHLVGDYVQYFELPGQETGGYGAGIERDEFDRAHARLAERGLRMREADAAWAAFAALRGTYAVPLNAMAHYLRIPPAQWIGDRSLLPTRHSPIPVKPPVPPPQPVS